MADASLLLVRNVVHFAKLGRRVRVLGSRRIDRARLVRLSLGEEMFTCSLELPYEYALLEQLCQRNEYLVDQRSPVGVVVDAGSNIGLAILVSHEYFPGARIFGLEPDPVNFRRCLYNTRQVPGVRVSQLALAGTSGEQEFSLAPEGRASALGASPQDERRVTVSTSNLDDFVGANDIEFIDVSQA